MVVAGSTRAWWVEPELAEQCKHVVEVAGLNQLKRRLWLMKPLVVDQGVVQALHHRPPSGYVIHTLE